MKLIDVLVREHELIESVAGSLRTFARRQAAGVGAGREDGPRFLAFFRVYAGRLHHAREEEVLLPALRDRAELPGDRGPIAAMLDDHHRMRVLLDRMDEAAEAGGDSGAAGFLALALEYSAQLWHHIDAENSVLFPESAQRLRRHGVAELACRAADAEEQAAEAAGRALVTRYPPAPEKDVLRGDGCVLCPSYVRTCRGLEREWWNEWEWEEFDDHLPSG